MYSMWKNIQLLKYYLTVMYYYATLVEMEVNLN